MTSRKEESNRYAVENWFKELGEPDLIEYFLNNGYESLRDIGDLEDSDLREIGIHDTHLRSKLLKAAANIRMTALQSVYSLNSMRSIGSSKRINGQ